MHPPFVLALFCYLFAFIGGTIYAMDYACWLYRKFKYFRLVWAIVKMIIAIPLLPAFVVLFLVSKKVFLPVFSFFWVHLDILGENEDLYLRRFFMTPKTQWFHPRFLHFINRSDVGRDPHDHPGAFETTILAGGYDERIFYPKDQFFRSVVGLSNTLEARPGMTLQNPEGHTHMVTLVGPTWSWVKAWKRGKPWGFWALDPLDASKDVWTESESYGTKGEERKSWSYVD